MNRKPNHTHSVWIKERDWSSVSSVVKAFYGMCVFGRRWRMSKIPRKILERPCVS